MKFLHSFRKDWIWIAGATLLSFAFVGLIEMFQKPETGAIEGVDTLIPAGFLLIPIDVQNYEALDSLLGKYGVVDLFKGFGKDGRLIARNIRILRAPQNPSHFAVLAPESEAQKILAQPGNFQVALKGPGQGGTQIEHLTSEARSLRIHFDGE